MNWLDRFIFWLAKKRFLKRVLKAASKERLYKHWTLKDETPNAPLSDLPVVRARANYLYYNDPFIKGAVDLIVNRMIGGGSTPQARTDVDEFNKQAEALFQQWAEDADIYGQFHFGDLERLAILKLFLDGGIFFKKVIDNRRRNPFCLEPIEYSRLAPEGTPFGKNQVIHGIEINPDTGNIVAYHFYTAYPQDYTVPIGRNIKRIPATSVIHFSPFRRPGQLLGIPLLAPAIPYAYNLAEIIEAELITKKIEACFGIVIKTTDLYGRLQAEETEEGDKVKELAPGMIEYLGPGEDIEVVDPKRPGRSFKEFVDLILQGIARALGLSLEQITGDKSKVNYSSTRHSELELRDYFLPFRKADERYFLRPVWRLFIRYAIGAGLLKAPGYVKDPAYWEKHEWIFKGFDWVDPQKEAKAKVTELVMGATTLAEICAAKGKDWQEVAKQRAREKEFLNGLGLSDVTQTNENRSSKVINGGKRNASNPIC